MTPEPPKTVGVWGTAGQANDTTVYYFVPGSCLLGLYPNLQKDAEKYLRPGRMWEVESHGKGKHRLLRLHLRHWNPDNAGTCPGCKKLYLLLVEQRAGLPGAKADEMTGETGKAAKV
jgi:hypothetical protein